jgi:glycine cleavage system aminomethyltransferase T
MQSAWNPLKQSPAHHQLVKDGAAFAEISGWLVAEHFGNAQEEMSAIRTSVGLCDLSSGQKWEIKGTGIAQFLGGSFGGTLPEPCRASRASSGTLCRVSRHHAIFIADESSQPFLPPGEGTRTACVHATDRTSGLGDFLLCGPKARRVLAKLSSMDLRETRFPDLACAPGPLAAVQVLVLRRDRRGVLAYEILFHREHGEYLWQAIKEAGEEFHLRPFGASARRQLEL